MTWQLQLREGSCGEESAPERRQIQGVDTNFSGRSQPTADSEVRGNHFVRKVLKADREKSRRCRLNTQFIELGNALDPDRPKNDKATVLTDAIQTLKDLTTEVTRLKAEYTSLSEESHELTQEKNELKEEKVVLKSDIGSLNTQYQQQPRAMLPWTAMNPGSLVAPPPPYSYAIPSGPVPVHPQIHPYQFFPNAGVPNPCPPFMPYYPPYKAQVEKGLSPCVPSNTQPSSNRSQSSKLCESRSKFSDGQQGNAKKVEYLSNLATKLELKTPGLDASSHSRSTHKQESCFCSKRRNKNWMVASQKKMNDFSEDSGSSRCSSSRCMPDYSSESVGDGSVANI